MTVRILVGDVRSRLAEIPDGSVQTCVTSPPYFGQRDYRVAGQMGLEPTPEAFVAELVAVLREVRRCLRADGTLWLNLGDTYVSNPKGARNGQAKSGLTSTRTQENSPPGRKRARFEGLKTKDLIGIPWMVAFALRADGWFLRQDIVWHKTNTMPESVKDRFTKAHETLFLLSKSANYYFDFEAVTEPAEKGFADSRFETGKTAEHQHGRGSTRARSGNKRRKDGVERGCPEGTGSNVCSSIPWEGDTRRRRSVWSIATRALGLDMCTACRHVFDRSGYSRLERRPDPAKPDRELVRCECGREDAWLSHFATFPPELVDPCIRAGSPEGATVLDPFGGAGTTGLVAERLGRESIMVELNPDYADLARHRIRTEKGRVESEAAEVEPVAGPLFR